MPPAAALPVSRAVGRVQKVGMALKTPRAARLKAIMARVGDAA